VRIIRYLDDAGRAGYAAEQADGSALQIEGDIFGEFTRDRIHVKKLLAPILPSTIWCIGVNYRRHAHESGAEIPEYPVLFAKGPSALQHPGDHIQIPTYLKSDQVDFECERIQTILNGQTMQDWNTNDMIFDVPALVEFLAGSTTLPPGTVIFTGTPHGIGGARNPPVWLNAGDEVSF